MPRSTRRLFTPTIQPLEERVLLAVVPYMVEDINQSPPSLDVGSRLTVGNTLYFAGTTGRQGMELWKSDGTASGTVLVRDILPGDYSSSPSNFFSLNGIVYFAADDGTKGQELWRTDGTSSGTFLVRDINPGTFGSNPANFVALNGQLFFSANGELWRSDGTSAGTQLLRDINPIGASSPKRLTVVNQEIFFFADDGVVGSEPWKTDGTSSGTVLVRDLAIGANSSNGGYYPTIVFNNKMIFTPKAAGLEREPWITDGTSSGTFLLKDINTAIGSYATNFVNLNGLVYFGASQGGFDGQIWRTDGTSQGTLPVYSGFVSRLSTLAVANDRLVFKASNGLPNGSGLWSSDGTSAGTQILDGNFSIITDLTPVGSTVFFTGFNNAAAGARIWRTDGTSSGTAPIVHSDINSAESLSNVNGTLFFEATGPFRKSLFRSDGSSPGTFMIGTSLTADAVSEHSGLPRIAVNDVGYFQLNDGIHGTELWRSDGTSSGTYLVKDIYPGTGSSGNTAGFANLNGTLYFSAQDDEYGYELWKSDGTSSGTVMVKNISTFASNLSSSSRPQRLTNVAGTLYFTATQGSGEFVWKSNGTDAGTSQVSSLTNPNNLVQFNNELFFSANNGATSGLWALNPNTQAVRQVGGALPGLPLNLTVAGNTLFFTQGNAIYRTDGATLVNMGGSYTDPSRLVEFNGDCYFTGDHSTLGYELFRANSTGFSATIVADINTGVGNSSPAFLVNVNGVLMFRAFQSATGNELWRSDGTSSGTTLVRNIAPGSASSMSNSDVTCLQVICTFRPMIKPTDTSCGAAMVQVLVR